MELSAIVDRVIGLDIHQAQITAYAIVAGPDGQATIEHQRFGAFKRDRRALADWVAAKAPDQVVMESTGQLGSQLGSHNWGHNCRQLGSGLAFCFRWSKVAPWPDR